MKFESVSGTPRAGGSFTIAGVRTGSKKAGYVEVNTPDVMDRGLWETSGHWQNYREHVPTETEDDRVCALKPMNCWLVLCLRSSEELSRPSAAHGRVWEGPSI